MKTYTLTIQTVPSQTTNRSLICFLMPLLNQYELWLCDSHLVSLSDQSLQWNITVSGEGLLSDSVLTEFSNAIECQGYEVNIAELGEIQPLAFSKKRYVVTFIHSDVLSDEVIWYSKRLASNLDVYAEKSLGVRACEWRVIATAHDIALFQQQCSTIQANYQTDIIIREWTLWQRSVRLAVFDMDSTLIQAEVIDELAKEAGVASLVEEITEQAMQGLMDFDESLKRRLKFLVGLSETALEKTHTRIELMPGVVRLFDVLGLLECKTAILSGGFTWFADRLRNKLSINHAKANQLEIKEGVLTGNMIGGIVNAKVKQKEFQALAERWCIPFEHTVAMGDGANDIPMLNAAGMGIAFHAKPKVKMAADVAITYSGLDSLLYLSGWHDDEIEHILNLR